MSVSIAPVVTGDDLARAEDDFFKEVIRNTKPDPFSGWEQRANSMGDLLPGEKFHLRYVVKNFDGIPINRWIVFCEKPPTKFHPGRSRIITVMTIEPPGEPGVKADPSDEHLDGLRMVVLDWREGRNAAMERMQKMKDDKQEATRKDAINEAEGRLDDVFWHWKRAMGENLNMCLGEEGSTPNHGGKHFGKDFTSSASNTKTEGGIYLP